MAEQEKRTSPLGKLVDKAGNVVGKAADAIGGSNSWWLIWILLYKNLL